MYIYTHFAIFGVLLTTALAAPIKQPTSPNPWWISPLISPPNIETTVIEDLKANPRAKFIDSVIIIEKQHFDPDTLPPLRTSMNTSPLPSTNSPFPNVTDSSFLNSSSITTTWDSNCKPWHTPQKESDCRAAVESVRNSHVQYTIKAQECAKTVINDRCRAYICAGCKAMVFHTDGWVQSLDAVWNSCVKRHQAGFEYYTDKVEWMAGIEAQGGPIPGRPLCRRTVMNEGRKS